MKITELIKNAKKTAFSFEVLPPLKGNGVGSLYATIDKLMEFEPAYINITTHRSEYVYSDAGGGMFTRKRLRKRPGTVAVAATIKNKYGVNVVPHILCSGFTKEETEYVLIDLQFLDIHDLLILRGDKAKHDDVFHPETDGHAHAVDLIKQVNDFNNGLFSDGTEMEIVTGEKFSYGVAGYPEKHDESPNMDIDMMYLKQKVDNGADYIVTQMFFDNQKFFDFVNRCLAAGINVPIIPGLKPMTTQNQISMLPQIFHVDIPQKLAKKVLACDNNKQVRTIGTEWAIEQAAELKKAGVPVIHFYTMGKADNIEAIAQEIFG